MDSRTQKQAAAITKTRNSALATVLSQNPGFSCQGKVGAFVGLYIQAEVFACKLQSYYCKDKKKKSSAQLNIATLTSALSHFSIDIKDDEIRFLFLGGTGEKGKKSARQLRNGYFHSLSQEDKSEIVSKFDLLERALKMFLSIKLCA